MQHFQSIDRMYDVSKPGTGRVHVLTEIGLPPRDFIAKLYYRTSERLQARLRTSPSKFMGS